MCWVKFERVKNVPGQKCAGSKMCRVKNVPGQKWAGQKCAGSKMSGSKMRYNPTNYVEPENGVCQISIYKHAVYHLFLFIIITYFPASMVWFVSTISLTYFLLLDAYIYDL